MYLTLIDYFLSNHFHNKTFIMNSIFTKQRTTLKKHYYYVPVLMILFYAMSIGTLHAQLIIEEFVTTDCACPDPFSDNSIQIEVSGGTPPYTYDWTLNGVEFECEAAIDFSDLNGIECDDGGGGVCMS